MRFAKLFVSFLVGPKRSQEQSSRLFHLLEIQRSPLGLATERMGRPWFPSPRMSSMDDDRIEYIFDFLRNGKVELPQDSTVTKETLLTELEFYGLDQKTSDIVLSNAIEVSSSPSLPPEVDAIKTVDYLYSLEQACEKYIKQLDEELYPFKYKRDCTKLALHIFREFKKTNKWKIHVDKDDDYEAFASLLNVVSHRPQGLEKFHYESLAHFGLAYKFIENQSSSLRKSKFIITLKKVGEKDNGGWRRSRLLPGRMDPPWLPSPSSSKEDDRIEYIFEFLRNGKVELPHDSTVTKETLLKELEFYGLNENTSDIVLSNAIQVSSSGPSSPPPEVSAVDALDDIFSLEQSCEEHIKKLKEELYRFEYKRDCTKLALYIFREFKKIPNKWQIYLSNKRSCEWYEKEAYLTVSDIRNNRPQGLETFHQDSLAHFGLAYKCIKHERFDWYPYDAEYIITLEKA